MNPKKTFKSIPKLSGLTRDSFAQDYLAPLLPVVLTDLMDEWPAKHKWTITHFKEKYGSLKVPVFSANVSKPGKGYMAPDIHMPFSEYLEMLDRPEPCDMRLFLFNIFKHAPELRNDYRIPSLMDGFFNDFPYMFFGGQGSKVALHFDIDLSHVFLNQIHGRKRVVLFAPSESRKLYHLPFTVASYVNVDNPNFDLHPAQQFAEGYEVILEPGESLFIPTGYWHYIEYTDGGYSISLRADESLTRRIKGALNIAQHYTVDRSLNKIMGSKWLDCKNYIANQRAKKTLAEADRLGRVSNL
ncbi:MAG TPA: cupin-like domain-containing protein [Saprospiraceae bacterium]|mgnify:CR=1 FL=1|nr:cupin-like domain-containing protein [Saprospiraceae bacterium]HQW55300.1 cupin-like domain-containing protein [Saprospiraceae bacterium]